MTESGSGCSVLLCATDHESAGATRHMVSCLQESGCLVKIILASGAKRFVENIDQALDDEQEWYAWQKVGDEVLHIELTRWADVLFISPCSANYIAKIANGLCDDLVMSVVRAWPPEKPVLLQLAMHMSMWKHPITIQQLAILSKQPNLYFVGQTGDLMEAVDGKDFRPEYRAGSANNVVRVIQQLVEGDVKNQHAQ